MSTTGRNNKNGAVASRCNTFGSMSPRVLKQQSSCQKECISIHIGQAGVQVGNACWELYCIEHNINKNGALAAVSELDANSWAGCNSFFNETKYGRHVPRAIFFDLEPTIIDEVRTGAYRDLYKPEQLISGKEDAGCLYPRGRYTIGKDMYNHVMDKLRKTTDSCGGLQGFFLFHSLGGGTGSGFTAHLLELLGDEFGKKSRFELTVLPSPKVSSAIVEPYNTILSTHNGMHNSDCAFIMDNEALYDICTKKLDIEHPQYIKLNNVIGQVASSVTASLRFNGSLNVDMNEFQQNLVSFPRMHFPIISYAPLLSSTNSFNKNISVSEITDYCFDPSNQLVRCNLKKGKYIACCFHFRGDVSPTDVNSSIAKVQSAKCIKCVEWCTTGYKVGIHYQKISTANRSDIASVSRAACMLSNNTSIADAWSKLNEKFDIMFRRRAFIHWYLNETMEEEDFIEARENMTILELDYKEVNTYF